VTQLLAWVWTPVLIYLTVLGAGILVDRVLHTELPAALLAPVGLVAVVVATSLAYQLRTPVLVPLLLVLTAVAGLVVAFRDRSRVVWPPPAVAAAAAVYLLYMAPVMLTGEGTWAGYNFVNDTASNFMLAGLLESSGVQAPTDTTGAANVLRYLIDVGYPLGAFSAIAGWRPLTGAPLVAVYQPMIATFAALCAMSLTELARRSGLRAWAAGVAAALALGGALLYRYSLHGAVKEVLLVALVATAVALACEALERRLAVRQVILIALACLAMVLVFSSAAGAFAVALAAATLAAAVLRPDRPTLRHVARLTAVAAAVGLIVLIPALGSVVEFTENIESVFSASDGASTGAFGQLVRPLPVTEAAGVWVSRDYRFPADGPLNGPLVAAALLAAGAGLVLCATRRLTAPLILLATSLVPALIISPLASPYIDAKFLVVLTPVLVFLGALAGLTGLQCDRPAARVAGGLVMAALVAGVGLSDLYGYRDARAAPIDRMEAMEDVAAHIPDRGLYLLNEWEEYGKYFMDSARINPAAESDSQFPVRLRRDAGLPRDSVKRGPFFGQWFDLDEQTLAYVQRFRGIVMRRSPAASRPPTSFRLAYRNRYYELWRRDAGVRVKRHLPLQSRDRATAVPDCARLRRLSAQASPGDRLVAATRPRVARLSPLLARHPDSWPRAVDPKGTLTPNGPGAVRGVLTAQGDQRIWLRASASRDLTVYVDGRRAGSARQINTPGQWIDVGRVRLGGRHRVEVRRGGVSWRPGDSYYGYLGPVALEAVGADRLLSLRPARATSLCGRQLDWVELVGRRR